MKRILLTTLICFTSFFLSCKNHEDLDPSGTDPSDVSNSEMKKKASSYTGLIMAGYQGWFNAEGDGANRGWNHYRKGNRFEPGHTTIDMWPEMSEYQVQYPTPFLFDDGSVATVFSSYDESTTDLHFKWMKDYGVDGVFMQRFVTTLRSSTGYNHNQKVLRSSFYAAQAHGRVLAIMYDLSGIVAGEENMLIEDWKNLVREFNLNNDRRIDNYLCHNGKPLVAIWGVGFDDNRQYGLNEAKKIIDFIKNDPEYGGFSIMLGVPTYWRTLTRDAVPDTMLHSLIKEVDIVKPWAVGRYNMNSYENFRNNMMQDIAWCKEHGVDYVPVVFPGFSWHNMYSDSPSNQTPRLEGRFFWRQLYGAMSAGAEMIYVAMFDEIDEGTAIFKLAHRVPVGESVFVPLDESTPSDFYLYLTGQAGKMLRGEIPLQSDLVQNITNGTQKSPPSHIHLSHATTSGAQDMAVNVTWINQSDCWEQTVQYGRTQEFNKSNQSTVNSATYGCIHKAVMNELQPSSKYYYRVGTEANGWSEVLSFVTAPPIGSSESFKVAVFGDTQDNEFNTEFEKTESIIESLTSHNADFSIHYGDVVVNGSYTNSWLNFIKTAEPLISKSPMMMTLGNHDIINSDNEYFQTPYPIFYDLFTMPGNGLDYAFTYGNTHFVCVYAGHAGRAEPKGNVRYGPGSTEREWLESELSWANSNPDIDWVIAYMHYPVYSFGSSNIAGWKANIAPVFDAYKVDLSLAGHRHAYERHHPIYNGVRAENNQGTVYITNGTSGGSPQGAGGSNLPTMAFTISQRMYNYAVMTISGKKLEYDVYDINDVLIDTFVMEK